MCVRRSERFVHHVWRGYVRHGHRELALPLVSRPVPAQYRGAEGAGIDPRGWRWILRTPRHFPDGDDLPTRFARRSIQSPIGTGGFAENATHERSYVFSTRCGVGQTGDASLPGSTPCRLNTAKSARIETIPRIDHTRSPRKGRSRRRLHRPPAGRRFPATIPPGRQHKPCFAAVGRATSTRGSDIRGDSQTFHDPGAVRWGVAWALFSLSRDQRLSRRYRMPSTWNKVPLLASGRVRFGVQ